jgi:3-oxoacyl-[acyl-carrier protein] reductase
MQIRGTSALVTGAGRGIGRAVALALGREASKVTLVARTRAELEAVAAEIQDGGGQARVFAGDLREGGVASEAVAAAAAAHGGLQILVNNAGVGGFANLADTTDQAWDDILATNLTSVFKLTRAALPHLAKSGGRIFMVSSLAGSNPIAGMAAYCASKAALDQLATCLMLEVRHLGIKVTTVAPGSVDTTFGGSPRSDTSWMLTPEDIAKAIVDLLETRDGAHLSRVEMRPAMPQKRV